MNEETFWKRNNEIIVCNGSESFSIDLENSGLDMGRVEAAKRKALERGEYKQITFLEFSELIVNHWKTP